jgi:hypothetical protein
MRSRFSESARSTGLLVAVAVVVALAGCSGAGEPSSPRSMDPAFVSRASAQLDAAKAAGASDAQVSQLEGIVASGTMTFADAREAVERAFTCFDAAGVPHSSLENSGGAEFPEISYTFGDKPGVDSGQSLAIADSCLNSESFFIEWLYASSPGFRAHLAEQFELVRGQFTECLASAGVEVDPGLSYAEMKTLAVQSGHDGYAVQSCLALLP